MPVRILGPMVFENSAFVLRLVDTEGPVAAWESVNLEKLRKVKRLVSCL